jgi:cytochrome c
MSAVDNPEEDSMKRLLLINSLAAWASGAATAIAGATEAPVATPVPGDPAHGRTLYQACQACHSIDDNDLGPKHRGVVGRRAGSVADYNYSLALKSSGLTWDATTLDRWLSNPSALVPGTKMYFKIDDAQARADIISYLAQLK